MSVLMKDVFVVFFHEPLKLLFWEEEEYWLPVSFLFPVNGDGVAGACVMDAPIALRFLHRVAHLIDDLVELLDDELWIRVGGNLHDNLVRQDVSLLVELALHVFWESTDTGGCFNVELIIFVQLKEFGNELEDAVPVIG